ncbi:hypothetical protein LJC12_01015 [Odoribacter sp. OttesenSCG-928-J03]|nr:hypothetical protein [Odoribacter sp. OttesenSCG-928-J03]MDL2282909.1 hypothetical protein [Odoribacter sp. OttesenSCG-928-G04]MDL2330875.1 hypothetical protein [Odoribacter sp. OttesenSCG-928-A06]
MAEFKYTISEPINLDVIEEGVIKGDDVLEMFLNYPWEERLREQEGEEEELEDEFNYSHSLDLENEENNTGLSINAVGNSGNYTFQAVFNRPKEKKTFLGLSKKIDHYYTSDLSDLSKQEVAECVKALIAEDLDFLEERFGN